MKSIRIERFPGGAWVVEVDRVAVVARVTSFHNIDTDSDELRILVQEEGEVLGGDNLSIG